MEQALMALIRKKSEAQRLKFKLEHEVFVIAFNQKPLITLGLQRGREMDDAFAKMTKNLRSFRNLFSDVNYLKGRPPLVDPDFGPIFWYLVLTMTKEGQARRESLECDIR